jgi:hypothetical protein
MWIALLILILVVIVCRMVYLKKATKLLIIIGMTLQQFR